MRVIVTGSRDYNDEDTVWKVMQGIYSMHLLGWQLTHVSPLTIVTGGAKGADSIAKMWAETPGMHPATEALADPDIMDVLTETYPAKWKEHHPDWCPGSWCQAKKFCVVAGPRRNQEMVDLGADQAVAFINKALPKSRGTADMVQRLSKANIPTIVVRTQ